VVMILSKSGDSPELAQLLPPLRRLGVKIIALTGGAGSQLARASDVVLDCSVAREACPFDLAPTSSTTAMLALGDALAVVLYELKGFTRADFAATHPGGVIGRRLLLKLEDIMKRDEKVPVVAPGAPFEGVVMEISRKRLGATFVVDGGRLRGIITDGDLRRLLELKADIYAMNASEMMTPDPMSAPPDMLGSVALVMLEERKRMQLPVVDGAGGLLGVVHLHDLIEAGLKA
jgi:arabinose-5-phosphate isomerase